MCDEILSVHRERKLKAVLDKASSPADRLCMELAYEIGYTEALETALKMIKNTRKED